MTQSWQDYWIQSGYTNTVGKVDGPAGRITEIGTYRPDKAPVNLGDPNDTMLLRWGFSSPRVQQGSEAAFVDPSVMDQWAKARSLDLFPATEADRQDAMVVCQKDGIVWALKELRAWLNATDGGQTAIKEAGAEAEAVRATIELLGQEAAQFAKRQGDIGSAIISAEHQITKLNATVATANERIKELTARIAELMHTVNPAGGKAKAKPKP